MTAQRILVIGAGALGIVTAVRLALAGHHVSVVASSESRRTLYRERQFRLDAYDAPPRQLPLDVLVAPDEAHDSFDLLVAATKCAAAVEVTRKWIPALHPEGLFVPYFNGLMSEELVPIVGTRLVECAVYYPATLLEPGRSRLTGKGGLHLGPWPHGDIGPRSPAARAMSILDAVVPAQTHDDMFSVKWNKLIANCAMTSLGVISGMTMGSMIQHAAIRDAWRGIFRESVRVARAAGARTMTLGGVNVGLATVLPRFAFHLALRMRAGENSDYMSSSQQSLIRGEPTEVDYLNGRVAREGELRGLPTPWNLAVVQAVKQVEAAPESAGLAKISELLRRAGEPGAP